MILKHPITKLLFATFFGLAISNFVLQKIGFYGGPRPADPTKYCQANLKQLEAAKEEWAMAYPKPAGKEVIPSLANLIPAYLKTTPQCPTGGSYTLGDLAHRPKCSAHGIAPEMPNN